MAATHFEFVAAKGALLLACNRLAANAIVVNMCTIAVVFAADMHWLVDEDVRCGNLIAAMLSLAVLVLLLWRCDNCIGDTRQSEPSKWPTTIVWRQRSHLYAVQGVVASGWLTSGQSLSLSDTKI